MFLKDGKISKLIFVNKMILFSFSFVENKGLPTRLTITLSKRLLKIFNKREILNRLLDNKVLILIKKKIK